VTHNEADSNNSQPLPITTTAAAVPVDGASPKKKPPPPVKPKPKKIGAPPAPGEVPLCAASEGLLCITRSNVDVIFESLNQATHAHSFPDPFAAPADTALLAPSLTAQFSCVF
jgi:hypothetical protein